MVCPPICAAGITGGGYTATTDIQGVGPLAGFGQATHYSPVSRGDSTYSLKPGSATTLLQMNGLPVGTTRNGYGCQATYLAFPPAAMEPTTKRLELLAKIFNW